MDQIAPGLSTRNDEPSIEALGDGYGIKKSSVSRHFIAASRRELEELLNRNLSDLDIGAVFLDGVQRGGQCVVLALGVATWAKSPLEFSLLHRLRRGARVTT